MTVSTATEELEEFIQDLLQVLRSGGAEDLLGCSLECLEQIKMWQLEIQEKAQGIIKGLDEAKAKVDGAVRDCRKGGNGMRSTRMAPIHQRFAVAPTFHYSPKITVPLDTDEAQNLQVFISSFL